MKRKSNETYKNNISSNRVKFKEIIRRTQASFSIFRTQIHHRALVPLREEENR